MTHFNNCLSRLSGLYATQLASVSTSVRMRPTYQVSALRLEAYIRSLETALVFLYVPEYEHTLTQHEKNIVLYAQSAVRRDWK